MNDSYSYKEVYKLLEQLKAEVYCLTDERDSWKYRYETLLAENDKLKERLEQEMLAREYTTYERD